MKCDIYIDGILPKGPSPPCLRMAGYPWYVKTSCKAWHNSVTAFWYWYQNSSRYYGLLMPWLLVLPSAQQPCYCRCELNRSLSSMREDLNYYNHLSVEKYQKIQIYFTSPKINSTWQRFRCCIVCAFISIMICWLKQMSLASLYLNEGCGNLTDMHLQLMWDK